MSKDQYYDEGPARKYWMQLPNMIDDSDLDVYEFRLYAHYKRVAGDDGKCWQSKATVATLCGISAGKASEATRSLEKRGLITIEEVPSGRGQPYHIIRIVDIWPQNMALYNQSSPHEVISSPGELIGTPGELIGTPGEIKKNPLRRTQKEEQLQQQAKSPEPASSHPDQADWTAEDHDSFECVLYSWTKEFGKLTPRQVEKMIRLWNLYPEEEIHEYAWNEMIEARDKRKVRPNLAYYEKCLETETRTNWVLNEGGNGHG